MEDISEEKRREARPYFVSSMRVWGFWRDRELSIDFDRYVNFLIGPNGTGKTTIVNLLNAILSCDFRSLDRIDFQRAIVTLTPARGLSDGVSVEVSKSSDNRHSFQELNYRINNEKGKEIASFSFNAENQLAFRDPRYFARRKLMGQNIVQEELASMVDISWLSVHRHDSVPGERTDSNIESLVDMKLDIQSNLLVRYFSKLDQRSAAVLTDFQKSVFLSLLSGQEGSYDFWDKFDFDVQKEKADLVPILEKFKIQRSRYQAKVEKHFEVLAAATNKSDDDLSLSSNEVVAIVNQRRIHEVVQEWTSAIQQQAEIYKMRDTFIRVLNSMFINKDVSISSTNETVFKTGRGRIMPIRALSSGEKQLLIIMGQALLQDCRPSVFIADEPELSLHVVWQERLVDCIREINPAAQVIFATHSPDIVGKYTDRVIESSEVFVK